MIKYKAGGLLHAKMHLKTGRRNDAAVEIGTKGWSVSSKSFGLGSIQTAYLSLFLWESRMEVLRVLKLREEVYPPLSRRGSHDGAEDSVSGKKQDSAAAWKLSEIADQAMRLLRLKFFKHTSGLLVKNKLYAPENEKLFEWSAVEGFFFKSPALALVSATLRDESARPLQATRPARFPADVVQFEEKGSGVR